MMERAERSIAEIAEILAFYTRVMRGDEEDASISNRISAADKLLGQHLAQADEQTSVEKLDRLLDEFRCAVMTNEVVGYAVQPEEQVGEEALYCEEYEREEDEDWEDADEE